MLGLAKSSIKFLNSTTVLTKPSLFKELKHWFPNMSSQKILKMVLSMMVTLKRLLRTMIR